LFRPAPLARFAEVTQITNGIEPSPNAAEHYMRFRDQMEVAVRASS
jgi:hypothetical protein